MRDSKFQGVMGMALKKQSLVDQIYDQIRTDIISLKMPLGGRLNVSELQEKFGISSTPIREAINRLQKDGLVEYENNVGARIMALNEKDIYEISELAMTLHSAAVRFAMKKADHEKMAKQIQTQIQRYKKASTVEERTKSVHELVGVFYKNCGNSRLDANMTLLKGQQLLLRNIYGNASGGQDNSADFEKIYEAVLAKDADSVLAALEANEAKALPVIVAAVKKGSRA